MIRACLSEDLSPEQLEAVHNMKNGCILCGKVGSGKSRTALAYYDDKGNCAPLYIITTARKRDTFDWEGEAVPYDIPIHTVDSWNNISKYVKVEGAFFIFDEQRVVGYGAWTKAFLSIAKKNKWILLSGTPGDQWIDYMPVFLANGYYKNKTDFTRQHVLYNCHTTYPVIDRYIGEMKLEYLRKSLLVDLPYVKKTVPHDIDIYCSYDTEKYKWVVKNRQDPDTGLPLETAGEYCYALREIVNSGPGRQVEVLNILAEHPRLIIFYSFDYELWILKHIEYPFGTAMAEWNGHAHEPVPDTDSWVYFVQYTAGAEGWNCITTDTLIFFSQSYSYKATVQAAGRIDRRNTPFVDLYYYHFLSRSGIDIAIRQALSRKKQFNAASFAPFKKGK